MRLTGIICLFFIVFIDLSYGQKTYFFGEHFRQSKSELPHSRVQLIQGSKCYDTICSDVFLKKESFNTYTLSGGWKLASSETLMSSEKSIFSLDFDVSNWYDAIVPGTVLTTLVERGVYPDPYWGVNNVFIPDSLSRMDWWYRVAFDLPEEQQNKRISIYFKGINYKAEVWINYRLVGKIVGAFADAEFDITDYVSKDSKNILAVRILPPNNPGIPQEQNSISHGGNGGVLCLDGPTFISSEGWDWMPAIRDRNIGIWQDVQLIFRKDVSIENVQILTDLPLPKIDVAEIKVNLDVVNHVNETREAELNIQFDGREVKKLISLKPFETKKISLSSIDDAQFEIENPRLWWPNGYGSPELYTMNFSIFQHSDLSDFKMFRFGIRELSYELVANYHGINRKILFNPLLACKNGQVVFDNLRKVEIAPNLWVPTINDSITDGIQILSDDISNPYVILRVNGQRIFCKGGNWGMDDAMKRCSRERLEPYVRLHKEQGFTMIRNWTAESTEEVFFDLCDEYGILVFNDFGLSTENYNLLPSDYELFLYNVNCIVKRFRNHPSIVFWCPQNEGFPPEYLEKGISRIVSQMDGSRYYIGNSRTLNTKSSGPWDYKQPVYYYSIAGGFASEVGSPSLPTFESLSKMMAKEDLWPIGDVWYYHDWLKGKWGKSPFILSYEETIDRQFGVSSSAEEFCNKAQLVNYDSYRAIFEAWNSKLFDTSSGILLWMSHPAWPSTIWQTYSWDYETPGAYFGAKKACEPLHIQYNLQSNYVEVVNTSLNSYTNLAVIGQIISLQGKVLYEKKLNVDIGFNKKIEVMQLPTNLLETENNCYYVNLRLNQDGKPLSRNFYWLTDKNPKDFKALNNIPRTHLVFSDLKMYLDGMNLKGRVSIVNRTKNIALAIKLNVRDMSTDQAILPVYFDDGYFSLLPNEERTISFEIPIKNVKQSMYLSLKGFNVDTNIIKLPSMN